MMLDDRTPPARAGRAVGIDEDDEVCRRGLGAPVLKIVRGFPGRVHHLQPGQDLLQVFGHLATVVSLDEQELDGTPYNPAAPAPPASA